MDELFHDHFNHGGKGTVLGLIGVWVGVHEGDLMGLGAGPKRGVPRIAGSGGAYAGHGSGQGVLPRSAQEVTQGIGCLGMQSCASGCPVTVNPGHGVLVNICGYRGIRATALVAPVRRLWGEDVQDGIQSTEVNGHGGFLLHHGLGSKGHRPTSQAHHRQIVGAIPGDDGRLG